jgi:hypothetical protein
VAALLVADVEVTTPAPTSRVSTHDPPEAMMDHDSHPPAHSGITRPTHPATGATRALLGCGIAAGPVFVLVSAAQVLTREGFDLGRHPISLLALGELGWIQVANFVVAGLLAVAGAVGMRRVLHPGRAGTWGPLLVGAFGVGLALGGVFPTDPYLGFPPGATAPASRSWHALVHDLAPGLALDAVIIATAVFARRFAECRRHGWTLHGLATGAAVLVLSFWPSLDGISVRLAVAVMLAFAWVSAISTMLRPART